MCPRGNYFLKYTFTVMSVSLPAEGLSQGLGHGIVSGKMTHNRVPGFGNEYHQSSVSH